MASYRNAAPWAIPDATGSSSAISDAARTSNYRDDLQDMVHDGFLNRLDLAFSRDQADRVYVQHKMLDHGADVWRWLDEGRISMCAATPLGWPGTSTPH